MANYFANDPGNGISGETTNESWSGDLSLLKWLRDAELSTSETVYRKEAMEGYRFYAGDQDSKTIRERMADQKRPGSVYNEIKPKVDMLIGLAAQTKHEPVLIPASNESAPLAELMNHTMKHFRKKMKLSRKELECFEHTVKSGRSLLHFYIDKTNPFEPEIKAKRFYGRNFYVDPQSVELDLSDARYLFLETWLTEEMLKSLYPGFDITAYQSFVMGSSCDLPEFFNEARTLYRLIEGWYIKYEQIVWFVNPMTQKAEWLFPDEFKLFARACKEGIPLPNNEKKTFPVPQITMASKKFLWSRIFSGGTTLEEGRSPYLFERFPSVLFGAYRNEDTNSWFSAIKTMIDPQKALNTMRRQLSHLLQTLPKGILVHEAGAILNIEEYEQRSANPNFHMEVGIGKLNAYKFEQQPQISPIYQTLSAEMSDSIKDTSGIQNETMGQETSSRTPGITVQQRYETSLAVLYSLFDNYKESRLTGDVILMNLIQQYVTQPMLIRIEGKEGLMLLQINSQINPDAPGFNDITAGDYELDMDETIETSSSRKGILQTLVDYNHNNPGAIPLDIIMEYSDVPYSVKEKVRAAQQAQQEAQQRQEDRVYELELLKIQAKVDETNADKIISEKELEIKKKLATQKPSTKQSAT